MRPRPDWLRVVEGGAGPADAGGPRSARPAVRRTGAHRCAAPRPLTGRALDVEEHASFRWNASPWVKWLPAALTCCVLSGVMAWDLGRLWLQREDAAATAPRPSGATVAAAGPGRPEVVARTVEVAPSAGRDAKPPAAATAPAAPPDTTGTLALLAAASCLAALPPPAPEPGRTDEEPPAAIAPAPAPVAHLEHVVRVIPAREGISGDAEPEELVVHIEGLPEGAGREMMDSVRREIRAWRQAARQPATPAVSPPAEAGPAGAHAPGERPTAPSEGEPRLVVQDEGSPRIGLQRLSAPALPRD
jgi:hypothetical protein